MSWLYSLSYFFGGMFLVNAIPHFVNGVMGHPFQSPFADPPGKGLSSSRINVLWGSLNLVIGYGLVFFVGAFDFHAWMDILPVAVGGFFMALVGAELFGKLHGGNLK